MGRGHGAGKARLPQLGVEDVDMANLLYGEIEDFDFERTSCLARCVYVVTEPDV